MKQLNQDRLARALSERLRQDVVDGRISGAVVGVYQQGIPLYETAAGVKDVDTAEPLTTQALFRLASMTKPLTAACVLMLVDQGRLSLDDRLDRYLPEFAQPPIGTLNENRELIITGQATTPITVEHLLSHHSGLGCRDAGYAQLGQMCASDKQSLATAVRYISTMALDFNPGDGDAYSATAAFDVAAYLVELIADCPFADFADEHLFRPLGMTHTTFAPTLNEWEAMVTMSRSQDGRSVSAPMPHCVFEDFPTTYTCGGAGAASCLNDYVRFAEMLRQNGTLDGRRVLSAAAVEQMRTPRPPCHGSCWGLGVRVNRNGFYPRIPEGSFGWSGAYGTHFWIDPANQITAVYLKNSRTDGGSGAQTAAHFEEDVYAALDE